MTPLLAHLFSQTLFNKWMLIYKAYSYQDINVNFQQINKNQTIAEDSNGPVRSPMKGRIFMPLYQKQGSEGFFIIEEIRKFWLELSESIRKMGLDRFMHILPGVRKDKNLPECFVVNRRIAAFFVLDFFHLLGYRKVIRRDKKFIVKRRPFDKEQPPIEIVKERYKEISRNGLTTQTA